MIANVQTELLRNAVNKVLNVVDKKNSRPILTYTLIDVKEDCIELSATDLEVSAKISIEAEVEKPGKFCVNAKNIFEILRELPQENVHLNINESENSLELTCNDIFYSLLINKSDDYPQLVFENTQNEFALNASDISKIFSKTSYAMSTDETRLYLNGLFFQEIDSKLRVVAIDGFRLALFENTFDVTSIDNLVNGIIIPRKGVGEIKRMADSHPEATITFSLDDSFLYAAVNGTYFLSVRLIAREYPKYQVLIPSKTSFKLQTERDAFLNAVRRIKIMSNERSHGVKIRLSSNEAIVMANHPSLGDATEKVPVEYDGKEMEIGFNARYLMDTLSSFESGEISVGLNNELSTVIFTSPTQPNYLSVVMPLRI